MFTMLKATETENVIKNIIQEITRECASRGINITDNCAAYVVRVWKEMEVSHALINDDHERILLKSGLVIETSSFLMSPMAD